MMLMMISWWCIVCQSALLLFSFRDSANAQIARDFECRVDGCCDQHENCRFWASIGECKTNDEWMPVNCQISCKTCAADTKKDGSSPIVGCTDEHRLCTFWSSIGECEKNPWMKKHCSKSCDQCGSPSAPPMIRPPTGCKSVVTREATIRVTRPSAREASRMLLSSSAEVPGTASTLLMQWGQFVSHDITKTAKFAECSMCMGDGRGRCAGITLARQDPKSSRGTSCLLFTRSSPACGSERTAPREQYNENTAFIDGSQIYGSSTADEFKFRQGAFMKTSMVANRLFPPLQQMSLVTGDDRGNLFIGLAALHTIFIREHNRIAGILQNMNRHWDADRVFMETRKIVGAELQAITYREFLPVLLGSEFKKRIGTYTGYKSDINPSIANEFSSAAFRLHGMIPERFVLINERFDNVGVLRFVDGVLRPQHIITNGVDTLLRGMITMPVKFPQRIIRSATEQLFGDADLAATNCQRGRDHGLPGYGFWREFCGLPKISNFESLNEIGNVEVRRALANIYGQLDNADLFVVGVLEDPVADGLIGPTFACIIANQFQRLRDGDRFFFTNPDMYTSAQIDEFEKVSIARILCDNGDSIDKMPKRALMQSNGPGFVSCNQIASINLNVWREG